MIDDEKPKKPKPYDAIADVMRQKLEGLPGLSEKAMFGGLCFMLDGNMVTGVDKTGYMFRVGAEREEAGLAIPGVDMKQMGANGRTMTGFLASDKDVSDQTLDRILAIALEFVGTLPPKD